MYITLIEIEHSITSEKFDRVILRLRMCLLTEQGQSWTLVKKYIIMNLHVRIMHCLIRSEITNT